MWSDIASKKVGVYSQWHAGVDQSAQTLMDLITSRPDIAISLGRRRLYPNRQLVPNAS